jgi:DNA-binding Lrp family transcriptional regulator
MRIIALELDYVIKTSNVIFLFKSYICLPFMHNVYIQPHYESVAMMKKRMLKLLFELMKNAKRSDREIAKIIGVSQPTITRMRQRLEKTAIVDYTVIPDWTELGFEIMAMTFVKAKGATASVEAAKKWAAKNPNVIFTAGGEGMGMDYAVISFHKNYSGYSSFIENLKAEWAENLQGLQTFLMTTGEEKMVKPFSLKYLEKTWDEV